MSKMKIPKGWRRLRRGEKIKTDDKFRCDSYWEETSAVGAIYPNWIPKESTAPYIRRITKKGRKK
jgi:hypothetical protein